MVGAFFPVTVEVLHKNLGLRMERHQVLTSNIANAETPGYMAKDVTFEAALREAVLPTPHDIPQRTHPQHLPGVVRSVAEVQGRVVASPSDKRAVISIRCLWIRKWGDSRPIPCITTRP
jgi:flagellar basal-body rod protein FlgB